MAHECPDCYSVCYCGGDIDDIELPAGAYTCSHCDGRYDDDDGDEDDYYDEDYYYDDGESGVLPNGAIRDESFRD